MSGLQELLALSGMTAEAVADFERSLATTSSDKEQRNLIKKLLVSSGMVPQNMPPLPFLIHC